MFYIFDCNTLEYFSLKKWELYKFVKQEGTVFGNRPAQKRRLEKKIYIYDMWLTSEYDCRFIKYIVYDEFMNLVDYKILEDWVLNRSYKDYKQFSNNSFGKHTFRKDPVEGTGGWGNGHYHRRPKTTNERRANCDPDYAEYVRSRRRNVPDAWEDLHISARDDKRSWKKNGEYSRNLSARSGKSRGIW